MKQASEIRKNRDRIRLNMKACLVTPSEEKKLETIDIKQLFTPNPIGNRKRRKTSEDIRIFDDVSYLKEIYIENSFQNLFEVGQKIGEGSHSVVYKCREIQTNQVYAVKLIKSYQIENLHQIKEQYRIIKSLSHENIVKGEFLFINEKLKKIHMVYEYCPFPELRTYMKNNQHLKESEVAPIVQQILGALSYLHKHGICHRDIKPENILYNEKTGELKLIDFEISKMLKYLNERLEMWTNTGTVYYKAPEMFSGKYNQLIDVWAVGVITFEMVFKKMPFNCDLLKDTIHSICNDELVIDSSAVTPSLIHFLRKSLNKNPFKRITALEALHTPFMLKFMSVSSSSSSPKMRRRSVTNTDEDDDKDAKQFKLDLKECPKISYSEEDTLNQKGTFSADIGIRFLDS